ncbi:hypothetical protein INT47_006071 [Mucor saturninus]|uniref:Uncharacterized protein n=1 Tax=Mucor saturninus TaxID=64648 RepID=A0A8H7REN4_9FUNG|nr:hypothetical protein INT47_006071 [Mucor saturninus]
MKAKINLYNRPSGRIDTYQPYNFSKPQSPAPAKDTVVVNRDNRLDAAYSANYGQACLLLRAIQMNGRRRLSNNCILQLAIFVAKAWETNPGKDKIDALAKLMTNLLDTTLLCPDKPFDEALKQFCRNNIPTHSVSPSITLLIAIGYIERLKQRYANIKGTTGCGHRLIMVAYMMAAKFMHVNLKSIINVQSSTETATAPPTTETVTATETTTTARTSAERSTISYTQTLPPIIPKNDQLPSPPTSPKAYSNSDPLNYHYFQSPSKKSTYTTPTVNINHKERHFQILRMELEFLHFLNYDLSLTDTLKLIHWAQNFDDDTHYTSADEGGDEWDTED